MLFPQTIAVRAIRAYRKHLSPRKGYNCAWGAATGIGTCSGVGLRLFQRAPMFKALLLLGRQFDRCTLAAKALATERKTTGRYRRLRPGGLGQAGFVECDCGDCATPGPGCDIFDCPKGPRGCFSGLFDYAMCCDAPCGNESKRAERQDRRAQRAQARQTRRQEKRDRRRGSEHSDRSDDSDADD